jgi:acyl-coenzyme A synthetase/AMP-(fatty) acid ligase
VVPVPDEIKYCIPYAFIVKRSGSDLSEEDVKAHALKNAPPYQYPRKVIFLPSMPLNGVGKIDRKRLEARARAERVRRDLNGSGCPSGDVAWPVGPQ